MPNQQLIDYIKQAKVAGQSKEEITSALLGAGWKNADVEEAFAAIYGAQAPTPQRATGKKSYVLIALASTLAVLLIAGGGFVYWQKMTKKSIPNSWQTYRNEKYLFEIAYPPTFFAFEPQNADFPVVFFTDDPIGSSYYNLTGTIFMITADKIDNPNNLDTIEFLDSISDDWRDKFHITSLNGMKAVIPLGASNENKQIIITFRDRTYRIANGGYELTDPLNPDIFDMIAQTFQIIPTKQ